MTSQIGPGVALRDLATELVGQRILVLGAGGWFGMNFLHQMTAIGLDGVLAVGSRGRRIEIGGREWDIVEWDWPAIREWGPTVAVNFAFLTRDRLEAVGFETFVAKNTELSRRFLSVAALPSVKLVLTVSSGTAMDSSAETDLRANPYGYLKRDEEVRATQLATDTRTVVVLRTYSVSGPWIQRPSTYAFSDLVMQAASGSVLVRAEQPVYRRYVAIGDLLQVGLGLGLAGLSSVVESGGELVELGDLAERIVKCVNPSALLKRVPMRSSSPSIYASDDCSWQQACRTIGYVPLTLDQQIDAVWRWAKSR